MTDKSNYPNWAEGVPAPVGRNGKFAALRPVMRTSHRWLREAALLSHVRGGGGRMSEFPTEAIGALIGHIRYLERKLYRAELMHKRTAEHLREERRRRRDVEHRLKEAEDSLLRFSGSEDLESIRRTPAHYKGDAYVTCRRAMESVNAQGHIAHWPIT